MDNIALVQLQAGLGSNLLIQNSGTTRQFHSFSFALISYQLNREKILWNLRSHQNLMWTYFQNIQTEFVVEQVIISEKGFTMAVNSKASYWHYFISVSTGRALRHGLFSFREDVSGTLLTEVFLSFLPRFPFHPPPPLFISSPVSLPPSYPPTP